MDVLMPQLGETVAEGKISTWFRNVGDRVAAGDNLFEIETDKVSMEVQAIEAGVLTEIRVPAGETVPVGTVVAVISDGAGAQALPPALSEQAASPAPQQASPAPSPTPSPAATSPAPNPGPAVPPPPVSNGRARSMAHVSPFEAVRTPTRVAGKAKGPMGLRVTPLARRIIAQRGLDLEAIARAVYARGGSRIAAADAKAAMGAEAPAQAPAVAEGDKIEPLNSIRQQTAKRLAEAWRAAPHVFQAVEIDFARVDHVRQSAKLAFAERHGVMLTYLPFVARAACLALADFPRVNAHFEGDRLVVRRDINLGIAVDLGHEGLVVPVVQQAGGMTMARLATAIARLVEKARARKLTLDDLSGGTFSITNNGSFGTLFTTPIINVPQVAILSLDAVHKRPVVVETDYGDVVAPRPTAVIGQSFDHRAFDGAYSAAFLSRLKEIIETRDWSAELG